MVLVAASLGVPPATSSHTVEHRRFPQRSVAITSTRPRTLIAYGSPPVSAATVEHRHYPEVTELAPPPGGLGRPRSFGSPTTVTEGAHGAFVSIFVSGIWIDVTGDLMYGGPSWSRGFQSAAPDDLVAAPMTASFSLNNSATNAAGLVGFWSPDHVNCRSGWGLGLPCKITTSFNETSRTQFYGFLEEIVPLPGKYDDQTVQVTAVSWLAHAASALVTGVSTQQNKRGDQLLTTLLSLVTFVPPATSFGVGADVYPLALDDLDPARSTVVDGIDSTCKSGFDRVFEKGDGTLVFEPRTVRETYTFDTLAITDVPPGGQPALALSGLPAARRRSAIRNRFQVTVHPKAVDISAVTLYDLPITASTPSVSPGQTLTWDAPYVDPSQPAQQIAAFNTLISDGGAGSVIGTSGSLPTGDFLFGSLPGGGGTDVTASVGATVVFGATKASLSFTNTGAVTAYFGRARVRGQGIYDYQVITATKSDTASETTSGQTTTSVDCPYNADALFADEAATYLIHLNAVSLTQLDGGAPVFVHADDEITMDALLALEISSPIGITEQITGITLAHYWINSIRVSFDERNNASFVFGLAPRDPVAYWALGIAGSSELGVTTVVGL